MIRGKTMNFKTSLFCLSFIAFLFACNENEAPPRIERTIRGSVGIGEPISSATILACTKKKFDMGCNAKNVIGSAETNKFGEFEIKHNSPHEGLVSFVVEGGEYEDPATGTITQLGKGYPFILNGLVIAGKESELEYHINAWCVPRMTSKEVT
jgi:hypothetical protein